MFYVFFSRTSNPEIEKILDQIAPNIEKIILNHHLHSQRAYEVENDKVECFESVSSLIYLQTVRDCVQWLIFDNPILMQVEKIESFPRFIVLYMGTSKY